MAYKEPDRISLLVSHAWCEVHGTVHKKDPNPYDAADSKGNPINECAPKYWRNLYLIASSEETKNGKFVP